MTPQALLERLEAEGVQVSLSLSVEGRTQPSPETLELLKACRDDLITYLSAPGIPLRCAACLNSLRGVRFSVHAATAFRYNHVCHRRSGTDIFGGDSDDGRMLD